MKTHMAVMTWNQLHNEETLPSVSTGIWYELNWFTLHVPVIV